MIYRQAQLDAFRQINNYFYNYALGQGADPSTARQFANLGIGVAATEGINVPDKKLWDWSGDNGQSIGPFQLYTGGLGAQLNGDYSPENQLRVAAATMWNGGSDSYNTEPWFGVSRLLGVSPTRSANDSYVGQTAAENLGARISKQLDLPDGGAAPGALPDASSQAGADAAGPHGPASLAKLRPSGAESSQSPTPLGGSGAQSSQAATDSGPGAPIVITDVTSAGYKGLETASQSVETAGQTVKQGAEDVGQKIKTSQEQFSQTVTEQTTRAIKQSTNLGDWFAELTSGASGLVARIGVGLAAIVLIGLALWLAGREQFA